VTLRFDRLDRIEDVVNFAAVQNLKVKI